MPNNIHELNTQGIEDFLKNGKLGDVLALRNRAKSRADILDDLLEYVSESEKQKKLARNCVLDAMSEDTRNHAVSNSGKDPSRDVFLVFLIDLAIFNENKPLIIDDCQLYLFRAGYAPLYVKDTRDRLIYSGICNNFSAEEINKMIKEYNSSSGETIEPLNIPRKKIHRKRKKTTIANKSNISRLDTIGIEEISHSKDFETIKNLDVECKTPAEILNDILNYVSDGNNIYQTEAKKFCGLNENTKSHTLNTKRQGNPSRDTFLVCLIDFARYGYKNGKKMDIDICQKHLIRAGYAPLYVKNIRDCIIYSAIIHGASSYDVNDFIEQYNNTTGRFAKLEKLPVDNV